MASDMAPKVALVHGFATDAVFSVFRPALGADAGFGAFSQEVADGRIAVFRWGIERRLSLWRILGVLPVLRLYRDEERRALDNAWQMKLFQFLEDGGFETVVCHSLGCRFLLDTINQNGAPKSLKRIIFAQADVGRSKTITHSETLSRLQDGTLTLTNLYCAWDQSLIASSLLTGELRYGMGAVPHAFVKNVFLPLRSLPNLHTCSIRSPRLKDYTA